MYPYFSRISSRLKKKRKNGCHKAKLENRHLVHISKKIENFILHFGPISNKITPNVTIGKEIFNNDALF